VPVLRQIATARIDGSGAADTNMRVGTASSWSRLRVASVRDAWICALPKTDHAPIMLASLP
jgi:hypothetical protein